MKAMRVKKGLQENITKVNDIFYMALKVSAHGRKSYKCRHIEAVLLLVPQLFTKA